MHTQDNLDSRHARFARSTKENQLDTTVIILLVVCRWLLGTGCGLFVAKAALLYLPSLLPLLLLQLSLLLLQLLLLLLLLLLMLLILLGFRVLGFLALGFLVVVVVGLELRFACVFTKV